jgi:uncharacterized protein (TIGR03435 family)
VKSTAGKEITLLLLFILSCTPVATQERRFADLLLVPNSTGAKARGCCVLRAGEIHGEGITVRQLIEAAYRRHAFDRREVIGGPSWIDDERYDFTAQITGGHAYDPSGFPAATFATLRAYVDHHVTVRREQRDRPVYALVSVRNARPGLVASRLDCAAQMRAMERREPIQDPPCGASPYPGRIMARGVTMPDFATLITPWVDRPVIDRTGLAGLFDVDVEGVEVKPAGPFGPSYRPSASQESIFKTIEVQLGLRLEAVNAPIEVVVIEHVERPK